MTTAIAKTDITERFRSGAQQNLVAAANMTLHELVDEFMRLTKIVKENTEEFEPDDEDDFHMGSRKISPEGRLASRERDLVAGVAVARFGIRLDASCDIN